MGRRWGAERWGHRYARAPTPSLPFWCSRPQVWAGVKSKYWKFPMYFVPTCVLAAQKGEAHQETPSGSWNPLP